MQALVDGIDHVYVPMADASRAFQVLTEGLGLPVMWPFTSFGSFASGGVSLGSIKLEVLDANPVTPWSRAQDPLQIQGIALRPSRAVDDGYLVELDRRAVLHSAPETFDRDGRPAWTNVYLTDMIDGHAGVFVCDYHLPDPKDLGLRRRVLEDVGGGALGVRDVVALEIVTSELASARRRWQRLLDPLRSDGQAVWRPRLGPAISLVEGDGEWVGALVLDVTSAHEARRVWREVAEPVLSGFPLRLVSQAQR